MRLTSNQEPQRPAQQSSVYPQILGLLLAVSLILAIIGAASLRGGGEAEPLQPILLATGDWAPYSGQNLANSGVASTVVSAVFQQMGYQPQLRFMPWPRAEQATLEDETDRGVRAAFPYAFNTERSANFYYSKPIFEIKMSAFFNLARNPAAATIKTRADLAHFSIVPISGYRYPTDVEKYLAHMAPVDNNVAAFKLLLQSSEQRLLVVEATRVGEELLSEALATQADQFGVTALDVTSPIHLIASKRNPDNYSLIHKFDATLEKMQRDGSLARLRTDGEEAVDAQHTVRLQPLDSASWVEASMNTDGSASLLLPQGTRAVVERWSRNFLEAGSVNSRAHERVKVRVLNGPQRGHIVYVDERTIVLP